MKKLFVLAALVTVIGLSVFWFLTIPASVPGSALAPRAPDLGNGKTMFLAGGCSSCHAVPRQDDKTKLGGGLALQSPFGIFYVPNVSPIRATASEAGPKRNSSPRSPKASRRAASIIIRLFPTPPINA